MTETDHIHVSLLREKSLWIDVKGRLIMVYQRWHQGGGPNYRCVNVDILMLGQLKIINRPYDELVKLIQDGKMKYSGEVNSGS
jgi:hypothetical protein